MQSSRDWKTLSHEERVDKAAKLAEALKENNLSSAKLQMVEQHVLSLADGGLEKQNVLVIEGGVSADKADNLKRFNAQAKEILAGINPRTAVNQLEVKLAAGSAYIDIDGVNEVFTKKITDIKHKQGQVLLVDFWATWCPPCQAPMAHNQEMLEHNGDKWGDKVRIVGVSIDQTSDAVVTHVNSKGWKKVEHFHRGASSATSDYGVSGVPKVVLIDKSGTIVFIGHPAERKLENDINTLLADKKLVGVKGGVEEDDGDNSEYTELDNAAIDKELEKFEANSAMLIKN